MAYALAVKYGVDAQLLQQALQTILQALPPAGSSTCPVPATVPPQLASAGTGAPLDLPSVLLLGA